MAAELEQREAVVLVRFQELAVGRGSGERGGGSELLVGVFAASARLVAAQLVGEAAAGDGDQPRPGVVGSAVSRPLDRGGGQRLLDRFFAFVEVALATDERAKDLRGAVAQQVLDASWCHASAPPWSVIGRTSIAAMRAFGQRAAISVARSALSTSMIR